MTTIRLIQLVGALVLSLWITIAQPAWAANVQPASGQNAIGESVQDATKSDLSDIPNLKKVDYEAFQEQFGDVPGEHVPLINPDNPKVQLKTKTSNGEKPITTEELQRD